MNKCVIALQEKDVDGLDRTAGAIRGRAARVVHVVTSEMDNYEPGVYTEKVLEATKLLSDTGTAKKTKHLKYNQKSYFYIQSAAYFERTGTIVLVRTCMKISQMSLGQFYVQLNC